MLTPYPHQLEAREQLREGIRQKYRTQLLVLPTGGGKTMIAAMIFKGLVAQGYRGAFFMHRLELVDQSVRKLRSERIDVGRYQADHQMDLKSPVQVVSLQTFDSRVIRGRRVYNPSGEVIGRDKIAAPNAHVVIIDEAHLALGATYRKLIYDIYPNAYVIGLTATPIRSDGQPMSGAFERMVIGPSMNELIELGILVPTEVYVPSVADLEGVHVGSDGDYDPDELSRAMMGQKHLVGDAVIEYGRIAKGRSTIIFSPSIDHSIYVRDAFRAAGYRAEHIDHNTPKTERARIFAAFERGEVTHICNVNVLVEGFDAQRVSCIIDLKPTKNVGRFLQSMGRGLRAWRNGAKSECVIIDHAGNHYRHGSVTLQREWDINAGDKEYKEKERELQERQPRTITCPMCHKLYSGQRECPRCGFEQERDERGFPYLGITNGELTKLQEREIITVGGKKYTRDDRRRFYAGLKHYAQSKGYSSAWVADEYQAKFRTEPPKGAYVRVKAVANPEIKGWITHRAIRKSHTSTRNQHA